MSAMHQPPPIAGYRALSQYEVDLINEVKQQGLALKALIARIEEHIENQYAHAIELAQAGDSTEADRIIASNARRWLATGRTDLQRGFMEITRAIAQPGGF